MGPLFLPGAVYHANEKSDISQGTPVYMYLFTWQPPVFDGKYTSLHCIELSFVFDNIERTKNMTGGGEAAHFLASQISEAWISFAKNGDPNHKNLPKWPTYNRQNTATMHFDVNCVVRPQLDKELFELVGSK